MKGCLTRVFARTRNRSHARRGVAALALLACMAAFIVTAPAAASVTIGQLPPDAPSPDCVTSNVDYLQPSVTGGNFYIARQAGTITSWSTNSFGAGAHYVIKVFRRTTDPDVFQVVSHAPSSTLSSGINTVAVNLAVKSGDMIGLNESGPPNSCTFPMTGDSVLSRAGNLSDGATGAFGPQNDVRLNLSAVLVPDNGFTLGGITRDRRQGTATVTATTSNPGAVTVSGKGLKKHATRVVVAAGPVTFGIATTGKTKRRLQRKGRVIVPVTVTFFPSGGDPSSQVIQLKLRKVTPRTPPPV
jgi:hypothetical protein